MFMFRVLRKRFGTIAGALAMALACVASASAEVLVSEGCDTASDYAGAKSISDNGADLLGKFPKSFTASVGLSGAKWSGWGSKPKAYSVSLPLPSSFADVGLTSKGGACVGMARGSGATPPRWGYLAMANEKLKLASGSTFYFRGLLNVDSLAASVLTTSSDAVGSGNSFGFGLSTKPSAAGTSENGNPLMAPNSIGFYYWRNTSGTYNLSAHITDASSVSTDILIVSDLSAPSNEGVMAENTFICFAEVRVGASVDGCEVVRVGAFRVSEYDRTAIAWSEPVVIELVADDAYPTQLYFTGDYQTTGCAMFDEFVIATEIAEVIEVPPTGMPVLSVACIEKTASGFCATASLSNADADDCGVLAFDGQAYTKLSAGALSVGGSVEKSFTTGDLAADKTSAIYVYAESATGASTNFAGVIYAGTPSIAKVADADESDLSNGSFTVSRADSSFDLTVNYACGGTAVNGVHCEELSGTVVIPAGATSVSVPVVPIVARPHDAATQLDVTIAAGNYIVTEPAPSASVIIANLAPPAALNTWIAAEDGDASVAENWSLGRVPVATDDILLDGTFSTAQLTWDGATEGMVATVASWTQSASYTGRVVMPTTRTGAFTCFTVTGDAVLNGGEWWRAGNAKSDNSTAKVWLNIAIGGNLTVGTDFKFNGYAAGYPKQRGPSQGGEKGGAGGAHGGLGGGGTYGNGTAYGEYLNPTTLGSGQYGSDNGGGGAIVLNVAGDFILDGIVTSDGGDGGTGSGQSGGSVWIQAKTMTGSGTVTAEGGSPSNKRAGGGGGRISIQLSSPTFSREDFAGEFTGTLTAAGGFDPSSGSYARLPGAAGTVYVECAPDNGRGAMTLKNKTWSGANAHTAVAPVRDGETWNLSSLDLKVNGRVGVYSGGTLRLPSFAAITGDGSTYALLLFDGGTLESDICHDKLVADGFGIENYGTSSFADYSLVIPATSSLKVAGDFTVGSLKINGDTLAVGDYSAATLAETYSNVSGDGTIHVAGVQVGLSIIVR